MRTSGLSVLQKSSLEARGFELVDDVPPEVAIGQGTVLAQRVTVIHGRLDMNVFVRRSIDPNKGLIPVNRDGEEQKTAFFEHSKRLTESLLWMPNVLEDIFRHQKVERGISERKILEIFAPNPFVRLTRRDIRKIL